MSFGVLLAQTQRRTIQDAGNFLGQAAAPTGVPTDDASTLVAVIIAGALTAIGTMFLILMVYGGYLWMTARGNEDQVTKARNIIVGTIIGLVVVVGAYAITEFITGLTVPASELK